MLDEEIHLIHESIKRKWSCLHLCHPFSFTGHILKTEATIVIWSEPNRFDFYSVSTEPIWFPLLVSTIWPVLMDGMVFRVCLAMSACLNTPQGLGLGWVAPPLLGSFLPSWAYAFGKHHLTSPDGWDIIHGMPKLLGSLISTTNAKGASSPISRVALPDGGYSGMHATQMGRSPVCLVLIGRRDLPY